MRPIVVAIGNRWRGDDALGPLALDELTERLPPTVDRTELAGETSEIIDAWAGRPWALVIDAIHGGSDPGRLHRIDVAGGDVPRAVPTSTHGAGLADAIALGRVLGRMPRRALVMGLEPRSMNVGDSLSDEVASQLPVLVEAVLTAVREACGPCETTIGARPLE